jgi:hypothetical protein
MVELARKQYSFFDPIDRLKLVGRRMASVVILFVLKMAIHSLD